MRKTVTITEEDERRLYANLAPEAFAASWAALGEKYGFILGIQQPIDGQRRVFSAEADPDFVEPEEPEAEEPTPDPTPEPPPPPDAPVSPIWYTPPPGRLL